MRSLMTSGALVLLAPLLSGCVGLLIETPSDENIQSPLPRKGSRFFGVTDNRWACQWAPDATPSAMKSGYLAAWGEPGKKTATDKGETWSYGENGRWCGFWIFAVAPIPFMLPICVTFDRVEFEGDIAVRSASRRITGSGAGIAFVPNPVTLVLLVPFAIQPGLATHGKPQEFLPAWTDPIAQPPPSVSVCH